MSVARSFRVGSIAVAAAFVAGLLSPAAASAATHTSFSVEATAHVTGTPKPYTLTLRALGFPGVTQVSLQLSRRATTGNKPTQYHDYSVAHGDVHCAADLSSCAIDTGSHMGGYGKLVMQFHARHAPKTTTSRCGKTGAVLSRTTTRKGTLTGTLNLNTSTDFFAKVTNRATPVHVPHTLQATATKFVSFDRTCPSGPVRCSNSLVFFGSGLDMSLVSADRILPSGVGHFSLSHPFASGADDLSITHGVLSTAPGGFLKVTDNTPLPMEQVHLALDAFKPFVTGSADFTAHTALSALEECNGKLRSGSLAGAFTEHFDGFGDYDWPGSLQTSFSIRRFTA